MPNLENRLKLLIHFAVGETSSKSLISAVTILLLSKIFRLFAVLNDICYFLKITELFHIPYVILRDSFTGRMIFPLVMSYFSPLSCNMHLYAVSLGIP